MGMLNEHDAPDGDDVVISGISGEFPSASNMDELRDMLFKKEDMMKSTWGYESMGFPMKVGFTNDRERFDASFFGMSSALAICTDPLYRKALEQTFAALLDAGLNPCRLSGKNIGVYMGSIYSESEDRTCIEIKFKYGMLGHSRAMLSNRISYWLNLIGPSVSVVTMETSGFEVLKMAKEAVAKGEVDAAIVGVSTITFTPKVCELINDMDMGFISHKGKIKPFDEDADGYLQSDAIVIMILQKARDANRIYASVVGVDIFYQGDCQKHFLVPCGKPLEHLMESFYVSYGVNPSDIEFLEAEGNGVKKSDEEEMNAVDKVLLKNRKTPLLIGSVKSNMGHTQASANFCSIAKILIAIQEGLLPPNLNFNKPSSKIPALLENRAKVVCDATPWNLGLVAFNGMSMVGTYAHALLKPYRIKTTANTSNVLPYLIMASSRTEYSMQNLIDKVQLKPENHEFISLMHSVYSYDIAGHLYRGYTIKEAGENKFSEIKHCDRSSDQVVWFIFSGMGSQWATMGKGLMRLPICAEAIEKCHNILAEKGLDLKHIITTDDASIYDNILHCFVGIGAIQIALVDMLKLLGITPNGMLGHSVGELGCAYADGCLTLEQTILSSYYRGIASLEAELIHGSMAAVGLGCKDIKPLLPPEIDVACHNSATSSTLSGPTEIIKKFVQKLQEKDIFARAVNVGNIAYHSRYIQPAGPILMHYLKKLLVDPKPRSSKWICSSVPENRWDTELAKFCSAEYLTNNLLSEVLFEEASKHIPNNAITIEIAPHGLLQAILRRSLPECNNISLTQRNQETAFTVAAIGKLYLAGLNPLVKELYPPVQMPVSIGTPFISPLVGWDHSNVWPIIEDKSANRSGYVKIDVKLNLEQFKPYAGNAINGHFVFPSFAYLKIVLDTLGFLKNVDSNSLAVAFEELTFPNQLQFMRFETKEIHVQLQSGSGNFEICHECDILASGRVSVLTHPEEEFATEIPVPSEGIELTSDDVYRTLYQYGYEYKKLFKGINKIKISPAGCVAKVQWANNWVVFGETLLQIIMMHSSRDWRKLKYPAAIQKIVINPSTFLTQLTEMDAVYNSDMQTVTCGGVRIYKTKLNPSHINYKHNQLIKSVKFMTHSNFRVQSIEQFVAVSLQWAVENSHSSRTRVAVKSGKIADTMKSLLLLFPKVKLQEEEKYIRGSGKAYDMIVVTKEHDLETAASLIKSNGGFLLTMSEDTSWLVNQNLVIAGSQKFDNVKLVLYRKTKALNGHTPHILHLNKCSSTWEQQIKKAPPCHRLFAVAELDERGTEIILPFLQQVDNELEHVRYVFILDKKAPKFSLSNSFYQKQLYEKDLILNVLQNGEWSNLCYLPIDTSSCVPKFSLKFSLENHKLDFYGLNLGNLSTYDTCLSSKVRETELGPVDFSGYSKTGERIMGFAVFDELLDKVTPDKAFTWEIPKSWSLEEAATVPYVYSMAYNALFLKGKLQHDESVLIHAGWSAIGQAAIILALDHGCKVFTSVSNEEQKRFIKQRFPQLLESRIYYCDSTSFELNMTKDTGVGMDVTLTCLSGEMLRAATRYTTFCGRVLVLGTSDLVSYQSVGMSTFLCNTSVHGISIQSIFALPSDLKEQIHLAVTEKIKNGVIKPLPHFVHSCRHTALRSLGDISNTKKIILSATETADETVNPRRLCSEPESFHLVVGSDIKQCLDVTEWLALRGVCQIAIATGSDGVKKIGEQRIRFLHAYHNTKVTLFKIGAANSASSISQLLQKASSQFTGPLEGIFILPLEPLDQENGLTSSTVANLDMTTREISTVKHFVCLLMKNSWSVCERRHKEGYPALSIFWNQYLEKDFNLLQSMRILDSLLVDNSYGPVVLSEDKEVLVHHGGVCQPEVFLPVSANFAMDFGDYLLNNSSCIEELLSLSPGAELVKEVNPVFFVPGLQGPPIEVLKPLIKKIMYPVFCVRPVQLGESVADTASSLVKLILDKQSSGTFNLIGASTGGPLTLELARLLESEGHKTRTILLDGAPDIIQSAICQLKPQGSLEAKLVSTILQTKVADELREVKDLSKLLKSVVKSMSYTVELQLMTALSYLRNYLKTVEEYSPSADQLKGNIALLRPGMNENDPCGLDKFFKQPAHVQLVEGDHMTILSNPETSTFINDFVL